MKQFVGSVVLW